MVALWIFNTRNLLPFELRKERQILKIKLEISSSATEDAWRQIKVSTVSAGEFFDTEAYEKRLRLHASDASWHIYSLPPKVRILLYFLSILGIACELACVAWRLLCNLRALGKRGSRDKEGQSREEPASLRSWRGFVRESFCFGSDAVNESGEAVRGLVNMAAPPPLARSRFPPATQAGACRPFSRPRRFVRSR